MEKVTRGLREATERIQLLDRENVSLKEDSKDLQGQIESGCKALQEAERDLRRAEGDKNELTLALDEAEAALEQVLTFLDVAYLRKLECKRQHL